MTLKKKVLMFVVPLVVLTTIIGLRHLRSQFPTEVVWWQYVCIEAGAPVEMWGGQQQVTLTLPFNLQGDQGPTSYAACVATKTADQALNSVFTVWPPNGTNKAYLRIYPPLAAGGNHYFSVVCHGYTP